MTPSQHVEKQRDESFISSHIKSIKDKNAVAVEQREKQSQAMEELTEDRSSILADRRQQDLMQKMSAKERAEVLLERAEELSLQRQIESRAAMNREKLKGSYSAVQHNETQTKNNRAAEVSESSNNSRNKPDSEAINLVV